TRTVVGAAPEAHAGAPRDDRPGAAHPRHDTGGDFTAAGAPGARAAQRRGLTIRQLPMHLVCIGESSGVFRCVESAGQPAVVSPCVPSWSTSDWLARFSPTTSTLAPCLRSFSTTRSSA